MTKRLSAGLQYEFCRRAGHRKESTGEVVFFLKFLWCTAFWFWFLEDSLHLLMLVVCTNGNVQDKWSALRSAVVPMHWQARGLLIDLVTKMAGVVSTQPITGVTVHPLCLFVSWQTFSDKGWGFSKPVHHLLLLFRWHSVS